MPPPTASPSRDTADAPVASRTSGLYHVRREADEPDSVTHARVVPQPGQNLGAFGAAGAASAPTVLGLPQAEAVRRLETLVRAPDPDASGASTFPDLRIVEDEAEEGNV